MAFKTKQQQKGPVTPLQRYNVTIDSRQFQGNCADLSRELQRLQARHI